MRLYPEKWQELPDGRRFRGEISQETNLPDGLGIVTCEDFNHFYVGEFRNGKRCGRGFLLHHEKWSALESVWVRGSYEEVMSTAEFDSCGRIIHVDNVGHYDKQTVYHEKWTKECDGIWDDDHQVSEISPNEIHKAPWKWAMTMYDYDCYGRQEVDLSRGFKNHISEAKSDGAYSFNGRAYVTVYDDSHLLFCDCHGHVFTLGLDETHSYIDNYNKYFHCFHLCLDEPPYDELFEKARFDELITTAFSFSPTMSERAAKYFLRVFYLRPSIFMLSDSSIKLIRDAAERGNRYAQFAYGRIHYVKNCDSDSISQAEQYLTNAHEQGLYDATAALSLLWEFGDMGVVDRSKSQELLRDALEHESDFAAVIQLKRLLEGHHGSEPNPQLALEIALGLRHKDGESKTPSGIWLYYMALSYQGIGNADDAKQFFSYAANIGVVQAWFDVALSKSRYDDNGNIQNLDELQEAFREGINHHCPYCLYTYAEFDRIEYDSLSEDERSDESASSIISMYKRAYYWGSLNAAMAMGDAYFEGKLNLSVDYKNAWMWYAKAALGDCVDALEKMFAMVKDNLIEVSQSFADNLALRGARLDSKELIAETVKAYTSGRLTEYAREIEQYYLPQDV